MFDIAWSEMLLIAVIAIIVVGPKDLPKLMTGVGRMLGKLRGMAREFQSGMTQLARESEIEEISQIHDLKNSTNPKNMIKKAMDPDGIMEDPVFPEPEFDGSKPDKSDPKPASGKTSNPKTKSKAKVKPKTKAQPKTKPKAKSKNKSKKKVVAEKADD